MAFSSLVLLQHNQTRSIFMTPVTFYDWTGFVRLQKLKNPEFSRAVLPFFSRVFPGFLEVQNENNIHNEL